MPFKNITLALNGFEEEIPLIQQAFSLKEALGASLKVLHVNDPDAGTLHMMMDSFPKITRKDLTEMFSKSGFKEEVEKTQFLILTEEDPVEGVVKISEESDLLIMGHHQKNALLALIGSTTDERIADKAKCPVMLVPLQSV